MADRLLAVLAKSCIIWPVGQAVKTRPFHGCNMGSIPVRVTSAKHQNLTFVRLILVLFFFCIVRIPHFYHTSGNLSSGGGASVVSAHSIKAKLTASKGAFAAYPRFTNWAAVFHVPLDCPPSSFFGLIAEQTEKTIPVGYKISI